VGTTYGFGTTLDASYEKALSLVKEALKAEGFGILTEIDIKQALKDKLGVEMAPYVILGACNPPLAHRALTTEPEIGLLLPCNVVVRADGQRARVEVADPVAMLGIVGNPQLDAIASEARQRLQCMVAALGQPHQSKQ
jgi:uncharacterized protein (DUF302 family)